MIPRSVLLLRRVLVATLASLAFASTTIAPLLDASEADHGPVLETEHDASTCARGHDHSICTRVGANAGATTAFAHYRIDARTYHITPPSPNERLAHSSAFFLPLGSRAPPLA